MSDLSRYGSFVSRANQPANYIKRVVVENTKVTDLPANADLEATRAKVNELLALLREASHIS